MGLGRDQSSGQSFHGQERPSRRRLRPAPDSLLWQPARAVLSVAAVFVFVAAFAPWATAMSVAGPVSFAPRQGNSDGVLMMVFASLLLVWTLRRDAAGSTSRTIQLIGPLLAFSCGAVWITADRATHDAIDQWRLLGWFGSETPMASLTLVAIASAFIASVWIDRRRPEAVRNRTSGLLREWQISRSSVIQVTCGTLGGCVGAAGGLALGVALTGGWSYAALLFVILAAFGLLFGAQLGGRLGRVVARRLSVS
jgi:hypothetical protein